MERHKGAAAIKVHRGTVAKRAHKGTVAIRAHKGTVAIRAIQGTIAIRAHKGRIKALWRYGGIKALWRARERPSPREKAGRGARTKAGDGWQQGAADAGNPRDAGPASSPRTRTGPVHAGRRIPTRCAQAGDRRRPLTGAAPARVSDRACGGVRRRRFAARRPTSRRAVTDTGPPSAATGGTIRSGLLLEGKGGQGERERTRRDTAETRTGPSGASQVFSVITDGPQRR